MQAISTNNRKSISEYISLYRTVLVAEPISFEGPGTTASPVNDPRGPSVDSRTADKKAKVTERLAHRACNTRKGAVKVVIAWPDHLPMLEAWRGLLADPRYIEAQAAPWHERPLHLLSDQEVLTALLGAVAAGALLGVIGMRWRRQRTVPTLFALPGFVLASCVAGVLAWRQVLRGQRNAVWEPTRRTA